MGIAEFFRYPSLLIHSRVLAHPADGAKFEKGFSKFRAFPTVRPNPVAQFPGNRAIFENADKDQEFLLHRGHIKH